MERVGHLPEVIAGRVVRLIDFALESENGLPMPKGWPAVEHRFLKPQDSAPTSIAAAQLAALFGDTALLDTNRAVLGDPQAPLAQRQNALVLLKRSGDRGSVALYVRLLEDDAFRSAVIPLLAGADDPTIATSIIRHFDQLNDADRAAALATLRAIRLGLAGEQQQRPEERRPASHGCCHRQKIS